MFVGIDLGASAVHVVVVDASLEVVSSRVFAPTETEQLGAFVSRASWVAIDAPSGLSTAPHLYDASLSRKFRPARCGEIALGRELRLWVPWVTPRTDAACPAWMRVGLRLFEVLGAQGLRTIEVYPHAGFVALAGCRLAKKTSVEGRRARVEVLRRAGVRARELELWTHDALDAAVAALTAERANAGRAREITCGHDGSAIWVP